MEFALLQYTGWLLSVGLWIWLFYLGKKNGLYSHYKTVFFYAGWSAFCSFALLVLALYYGTASLAYGYSYAVSQISRSLLPVIILLQIYWLFDRFSWRSDWHLVLVPALIFGVEFSLNREAWFFFRVIYCVQAIWIYVGLCAVVRRILSRQVILGWNLTMVMLALTVPGVLQALTFGVYLLTGDRWNAQLWNHMTLLSTWLIVVVGMTEYSPPQLVEIPQLEYRVARERMWGSIKILWRLLRS